MALEFGWVRGLVLGIEYATPYELEGTDLVWAINISLGPIYVTVLKF